MKLLLFILFASLNLHAAYKQPAKASKAMVTTAHEDATQAGLHMLKEGGNAVDAAVAAAFAISVVEPFSAGIGGGGFLILRTAKNGKTTTLDFREKAPQKAKRDMYLNSDGKVDPKRSVNGHLAVAVPGTVAGLHEVHRKHGKLPWKKVIQPAIKLAKSGFKVSEHFAKYFAFRASVLKKNPAAWQVFTNEGTPYLPGEILRQPELAKTLEAIAASADSFYTGSIAKRIEEDMKANAGLIRYRDLATYKPTWREPICGDFKGNHICSMPPPSSGGIALLEMLNMVSLMPSNMLKWHQVTYLHYLAEIMRTAYADRAQFLGDPAFADIPVERLTSKTYAKTKYAKISPAKARASTELIQSNKELSDIAHKYESDNTSHLNVVDEERNAISMTFTVNYLFGAGVVAQGTGILLNNEMDDFAAAPGKPNSYGLVGGEANSIAAHKIPLSSMSPMIATRGGKLLFVAGTPGGSRIISTMLNYTINTLAFGMNVSEAIANPRFHHQWLPDKFFIEEHGIDPSTSSALQKLGHKIEWKAPWSNANAIIVQDGKLQGAIDPRGEGLALGF